jgi:hypothetical protein
MDSERAVGRGGRGGINFQRGESASSDSTDSKSGDSCSVFHKASCGHVTNAVAAKNKGARLVYISVEAGMLFQPLKKEVGRDPVLTRV